MFCASLSMDSPQPLALAQNACALAGGTRSASQPRTHIDSCYRTTRVSRMAGRLAYAVRRAGMSTAKTARCDYVSRSWNTGAVASICMPGCSGQPLATADRIGQVRGARTKTSRFNPDDMPHRTLTREQRRARRRRSRVAQEAGSERTGTGEGEEGETLETDASMFNVSSGDLRVMHGWVATRCDVCTWHCPSSLFASCVWCGGRCSSGTSCRRHIV